MDPFSCFYQNLELAHLVTIFRTILLLSDDRGAWGRSDSVTIFRLGSVSYQNIRRKTCHYTSMDKETTIETAL